MYPGLVTRPVAAAGRRTRYGEEAAGGMGTTGWQSDGSADSVQLQPDRAKENETETGANYGQGGLEKLS